MKRDARWALVAIFVIGAAAYEFVRGVAAADVQDASRPTAIVLTPPEKLPARVDWQNVGVIVIDPQPSFAAIMAGDREAVESRLEQLYVVADLLQLPTITTFERPTDRKGTLSERLQKVLPKHAKTFEKNFFDATREIDIRAALVAMNKKQIAVAGAETDVCVLQSALGLRAMGFDVFLLEDCLFTAEPNVKPALERMYGAGVVSSTFKTFYFELTRHVGPHPEDDDAFRARWRRLEPFLRDPYRLPPSPAR